MKKDQMFSRALSVLCLLAFVLGACAPAATQTSAPVATEPAATKPPATESAATEPAAAEPVTLTLLGAQNQNDALMIEALTEAYTAMHPNVTFEIEVAAGGGSEVDNLVKTRLATGEMNDIFYYNSGSLLQALHPSDTLVDLSGEQFIANIAESFLPTVSQNGGIFGVPVGYASAGGVLYNKKVYEQLGLSVPKTWDEFAANNEKIKEAGIPPVLQTYGDTWTAQLESIFLDIEIGSVLIGEIGSEQLAVIGAMHPVALVAVVGAHRAMLIHCGFDLLAQLVVA